MERKRLRQLTLTAIMIAFGVVLPILFHSIPKAGMIFCPMHLPVLLCGLLCGPWFGLAGGLLTPLLSSLITGMPPAGPVVYSMIIELGVYGLIAGLIFKYVRTKSLVADIYIALVVAMLAGRIVNGLVHALIFTGGGDYSFSVWLTSSFVTCLPGIILHLIFVPLLYGILRKAKLIPEREPKEKKTEA